MNLQPDFNEKPRLRFNRKGVILSSIFIVMFLLGAGYTAYNWSDSLLVDAGKANWKENLFPFGGDKPVETDYVMPKAEANRYDILILGVRGKDDPDGGNLTDTIMLFSLDKTTGRSTLVSIPRDLYVRISKDKKEKINAVYAYLGLRSTEKLVSQITGVYVDNSIVFDFSSFKKIIDDLGGIDIVLDKPFEETTQWGYVFKLPTGLNHLDGENALYYVRSRYSSNDFDRARRQQQVMFAIKNKVIQMDFLSSPVRSLSLLNTLKKNINTDINLLDIKGLIELAQQVNVDKVNRHILSTADYLYESVGEAGAYVLLPQGDNFNRLKTFFQDFLKPVSAVSKKS
ncbi:MAG: LCP family protein [Patescibacteria group bacterium]